MTTMIRNPFVAMLALLSTLLATAQGPVKPNTVKIAYSIHTNSGIAISTTHTILSDSLVWEYHEYRNGTALRDACTYDKQDFQNLIKALAAVKFRTKAPKYPSSGGGGWGLAFYDSKKCYLTMNDESTFTGNYQEVLRLINEFIAKHKPAGERLFDNQHAKPHESGKQITSYL